MMIAASTPMMTTDGVLTSLYFQKSPGVTVATRADAGGSMRAGLVNRGKTSDF